MSIGAADATLSDKTPRWTRSWWHPLACGLAFGAMFGLALPPFSLWGFAFVALAPLIWAAAHAQDRPARSGLLAGLGTLPLWLHLTQWIWAVTVPGYLLLSPALSLFPAAFVWLMGHARRSPRLGRAGAWFPLAAAVWVGLEFFRGEIAFHGYPWFFIGHPTIDFVWWAQWAWWFGAYGVSLLTVATTCAAVFALTTRAWKARLAVFAVLLVVAGVTFAMGAGRRMKIEDLMVGSDSDSLPYLNVGVVQTNLAQSNKIDWSPESKFSTFEENLAHSRRAAEAGASLIVWPETMFPGVSLNPDAVQIERNARLFFKSGEQTTYFYDNLLALQRELGLPFLVGALAQDGFRVVTLPDNAVDFASAGTFNSAFLITGGAVARRYDKLQLTPFGETIPYISWDDELEELFLGLAAPAMVFDLRPGRERTVFEIDASPPFRSAPETRSTARVVTPICFEATMARVCRTLVFDPSARRRADVIVQLTNDGWFGSSPGGREQHLQLCRWRAIELATPFVRAVNTGISAFIWPDGSVAERLDSGSGVMLAQAPIVGDRLPGGPYASMGNAVGWLGFLITGAVAIRPMLGVVGRVGRVVWRTPKGAAPNPARPTRARNTR